MPQSLPFWNQRRVFVTGATGLVGSWLIKDLLAAGAVVTALIQQDDPDSELYRSQDANRVTKVYGDIEDYGILERTIDAQGIDLVFHLAAQTIVTTAYQNPLATFESNIRGTYNILEVCRKRKDLVKSIIVASSDKAYGSHPVLPYVEDMALQGRFPYDVSKTCTDLLAQSYFHTYALPVAIARCGNIYGGGDLNWSRIVPGTIQSFLKHEAPIIRSNGQYTRDYIYVKDISLAYMRLAENLNVKKLHGQAFNFSNEAPLTVLQMVEAIAQVMGCGQMRPNIIDAAQAEIFSQCLSSQKAQDVLGWQHSFTLEQGLQETVKWYQSFLMKESACEGVKK